MPLLEVEDLHTYCFTRWGGTPVSPGYGATAERAEDAKRLDITDWRRDPFAGRCCAHVCCR